MNDTRQPTMLSLEITVIRADGTIEPKGTVACWHRAAWRRLACRLHPAIRRYLHRDAA